MSYAKAISKDIYSQITTTVIEALEQGNIMCPEALTNCQRTLQQGNHTGVGTFSGSTL